MRKKAAIKIIKNSLFVITHLIQGTKRRIETYYGNHKTFLEIRRSSYIFNLLFSFKQFISYNNTYYPNNEIYSFHVCTPIPSTKLIPIRIFFPFF